MCVTSDTEMNYRADFSIVPAYGMWIAKWDNLKIEATGNDPLDAIFNCMEAGREYFEGVKILTAMQQMGLRS